jgi:hypothetical protein
MGKVLASTSYDADIVAWAREQAALLRAGKFARLDIEHIADEVEDVGKSEQRELANRLALLLAHLLKWHVQPERRGNSWLGTIKAQRVEIAELLEEAPSLNGRLTEDRWMCRAWQKAVGLAMQETDLAEERFPADCPWSQAEMLDPDFLPG